MQLQTYLSLSAVIVTDVPSPLADWQKSRSFGMCLVKATVLSHSLCMRKMQDMYSFCTVGLHISGRQALHNLSSQTSSMFNLSLVASLDEPCFMGNRRRRGLRGF